MEKIIERPQKVAELVVYEKHGPDWYKVWHFDLTSFYEN